MSLGRFDRNFSLFSGVFTIFHEDTYMKCQSHIDYGFMGLIFIDVGFYCFNANYYECLGNIDAKEMPIITRWIFGLHMYMLTGLYCSMGFVHFNGLLTVNDVVWFF